MDWKKKCILSTYLKLPFFAPFSRLLSAANAQTQTKRRDRSRDFSSISPLLGTMLPVWAQAPWGHWGVAQLLTLWLHEGKWEQKAVENGREITRMNISIFQEDSPANNNQEKEKPHWTWMFSGVCPNTTNNSWNDRMFALDIHIPTWTASIPLHKLSSSLIEKNVNSHPAEVFIKPHFCQTGPCFAAHDVGSEHFPDKLQDCTMDVQGREDVEPNSHRGMEVKAAVR